MNNRTGFIIHIVVISILLAVIVWDAEANSSSSKGKEEPYTGEVIIWPPGEPYHEEHHGDIILAAGGGADIPFTYRDYDFEVKPNATRGVIVCGNFTTGGVVQTSMEDIDIVLYGATTDAQGNRRVVATSASASATETIILKGTPDPNRIDDFDKGGVGTWTLRVRNYAGVAVTYDLTIDIYYDGARYPPE